MNKKRQNNIQQSIWYPPDNINTWWSFFKTKNPAGELNAPNFFVNTFIRDVGLSLFSGDHIKKQVKIIPEAATDIVLFSLDRDGHNLQYSIHDFSNKAIYELLAYGKISFEIVRREDNNFSFVHIPAYTLINFFGMTYQYIPKKVAKKNKLSRLHRISNAHIFCIRLPYFTKLRIAKLLKKLVYLSNHSTIPSFIEKNLSTEEILTNNYDTTWYRKKTATILTKTTKDIGWNARESLRDEYLEYYSLVRFLRFERFKCHLRTIIIDGLNSGLRKAMPKGEEAKIVSDKLISEEEINASFDDLKNGSKNFLDIIKPY